MSLAWLSLPGAVALAADAPHLAVLEQYCFDCHDEDTQKGKLNLVASLERHDFDGKLVFENLITNKMPPADKKRPDAAEAEAVLKWLAARQPASPSPEYRRVSRHEFVQTANDLLGTQREIAHLIPEDRGTRNFDSDRRIELSTEMLTAYFSVADQLLDAAFPAQGFPHERSWTTRKIRDSHHSYSIYHLPYQEGTLLSWTRANNGNSYSFFIDNFDPPAAGWYELSFDAAKVGDFPEDVSMLVYAGTYYYADDRPQPQRLLGVLSLANREVATQQLRVFLRPGETVSIHCYSKHNFRQRNVKQGAYLKEMRARGPLFESWPPPSFVKTFAGLNIDAPTREVVPQAEGFESVLKQIGGSLRVSSEQEGMEKEKLQDGSNTTFWHTRFKPTLAEPPHFVILENPRGVPVRGLSYATWTGGNGNGLVTGYDIHLSNDGSNWGEPIVSGGLDVRLSNEQPIDFPRPVTNRFIKLLVTDAKNLDGRSLASIGKLDVVADVPVTEDNALRISVTATADDLEAIIRRFAERAFATRLSPAALAPYLEIAEEEFAEHGDVVRATRAAFKAVLTSPRFLMAPGEHASPQLALAADLARALWLSVPDRELLELAREDQLADEALREQIQRMLLDPKAERMVHSLAAQWLNLRSLNKVTPSLKLYPQYNDLLDHFLPLETEAYLYHLISENLPTDHLIDSDFSFLNQRLAQHYGIPGVTGQALRKVHFPADVPRGGLLTMGSILQVTTDGYETSPILRGAWVSKNLIGTPLSPPPDSVEAIEPEHGAEAVSLREQIERHKKQKSCYACHKSIDPYGFALERFDATGQFRERYRVKTRHPGTFQYRPKGYYKLAAEVDASGDIHGEAFEDVDGLKSLLLADSRKIAYNFAKKFFEYTTGKQPGLKQRLQLHALIPEADCRMGDLIADVLVLALTERP